MKSIVLYERTLVQESECFQTLKEEKTTEKGNEKTEEKKNVNGTCGSNTLETQTSKSTEDDNMFLNGVEKTLNSSAKKGNGNISEKEHNSFLEVENTTSESVATNKINTEIVAEKSDLCTKNETNCLDEQKLPSEIEILKNVDSEGAEHSYSNNRLNFSIENNETSDDAIEIIEEEEEEEVEEEDGEEEEEEEGEEEEEEDEDEETSDNVLKSTDTNILKGRYDSGEEQEKESCNGKEVKQAEQSLEEVNSDVDENKENEKTCKLDGSKNYSSNDLLNDNTEECEIQVGEVQTITGSEKDSMWTENDLQKFGEGVKDKLEEKDDECQDVVLSIDESIHVDEEEKDEEHDGDENIILETNESFENAMQIEVEESEEVEEMKIEDRESEQVNSTDVPVNNGLSNDKETKEGNWNCVKTKDECGRKRQISENDCKTILAKKKKLSENSEYQVVEEEKVDSSLCQNFPSLSTTGVSSEGRLPTAIEADNMQSPSTKKNSSLSTASVTRESKKLEKVDTVFSVLEKFRGSLKTLTRSDLEELIVQKLCEVITERSNVGELRRKAAALEQDQERWKTKAQSLTKQIREMEMVMKKYMSEVQKQFKEGEYQVVTPIKVTRSVGLQVSFYSSSSKQLKQNVSQSTSPSVPQNVNTRNRKESLTKSTQLATQSNSGSQSAKNKVAIAPAYQSTSIQKPPVNQRRRFIAPKPEAASGLPNRNVAQQPAASNARGGHNQTPRGNYKQVPGSLSHQHTTNVPHHTKQHQPLQQQQHHQPHQHPQPKHPHSNQQNGSKVIDLTDDDDRQTGSTVKSGSIRVVSHLTQPQLSQNNRFAYLLPTTSASTGSSVGQSRQVLIATPAVSQTNRQIMCSMPPLLFKGGNVQSGSQPQIVNQTSKLILPKPLRHPAPLPQRPIYQNHRASLKLIPPRPALKISKVQTGIVLSWNMSLSPEHAPISSYQLYAYQESESPPSTSLWKKVGDVKALPLPMACTLTQFMSGHKYHFAVRAVDLHSRIGPFSFPGTIVLV